MELAAVSLDDKYESREGRIHITGSQAIVRLAMMQFIRDRAAGLDTACYITGYRGSPMHNIDKELWSANRFLAGSRIHFQPAVNEDLAATAIWGSQQATEFGDCRHDGVFSFWYGKGPGLDRSMDAIRHGHMAGSSRHGGVLVMVGDDHALTSTDAPAAHEFAFVEMMMPFLYPASVHEVLSYGLHGIALSRFSGAWVGYKVVPDTVDASAPLPADPMEPGIVLPAEFELPPDGLNLRIPDFWYQMEPRHRDYKIDAAVAYARANRLNRVTLPSRRPRYGIVATGKAWNDVRQALFDLGIDDRTADELGITVLKLAMPYPFDAETVRGFADGLEEVFVVEEKVTLSEIQVRNALYPLPDGRRPRVIGQKDESGRVLLPGFPEVTPDDVARALAVRIAPFHTSSTPSTTGSRSSTRRRARQGPARPSRWRAPRTSARAAPTTPRPGCRRGAAPRAGSGATSWPPTWTAATSPTPTWGGRARTGWARPPSSRPGTSSRTSATAPTTTRGSSRSGRASPPGSTSPTRSSSTTRWR